MAKGVLPEDHPLWLGVVGRVLRKTIEEYLAQADLVVGIGYDPVEISYEEWMQPAAPSATVPLVHVDGEPADVAPRGQLVHEAIGVFGDAVRRLAAMAPGANEWDDDEMARFRAMLEEKTREDRRGFQPWQAVDIMRELLPDDAILACDVGAHTHLVATQWRVTVPETLLVSNGWSSMGYAIPAALGAKLARPERTIVAVMGDGCFLMMAGEMATIARSGLPIPFVVLNDGDLSLIKYKDEIRGYTTEGDEVYPVPPAPPASYFGVPVRCARTPAEFRAALAEALRAGGPMVVEAIVERDTYRALLQQSAVHQPVSSAT
jgi:acetolactate synthase-1/2/3 large subunit